MTTEDRAINLCSTMTCNEVFFLVQFGALQNSVVYFNAVLCALQCGEVGFNALQCSAF